MFHSRNPNKTNHVRSPRTFSRMCRHFARDQRQIMTSDLCAGCTIVNGAGYKSHPTDCDKFIQCHFDGNGVLVGEVQQCAFSTYWNMQLLTCLPSFQSSCDTDMCENETSGTQIEAEGNCRGYWECRKGKAIPKCCPYGQNYNETEGCVDNIDDECLDSCFNDVQKNQTCDKLPVSGHPEMFQQEVAGWGLVKMYCAPGTIFNEDACLCAKFDKTNVQKKTCTPEIYLPFDEDHRDQSGKRNYVANQNVEVSNGTAKFNGVNSRLIIPRFTNLEHSTSVVIKIKYTSNHMTSGIARALVSNSDCNNLPSIMLSEDATNVYFGVGTSEAKFQYVFVNQELLNGTETTSTKEVVYKFDNGELTGTNGAETASVPAEGYLRNVQCALHLGHAENLAKFEGEIDEITVYLCNPDSL